MADKNLKIIESNIASSVIYGKDVIIKLPTNLYGCELGDYVFIGPFSEIQRNSKIGNNTRISSHSFICEGVEIGERCFIGHGVMFINDKFDEEIKNWKMSKVYVGNDVRIGTNATIMPVKIGNNSIIGAGSVVTKDVPENAIVAGNPARILKLRPISNT